MKIFTNIIFLKFLCFAHFKCAEGSASGSGSRRKYVNIELGSDSEPKIAKPESVKIIPLVTLEQLFPGSGGIYLPRIEAHQDPEFSQYANEIYTFDDNNSPVPIQPRRPIVKRGNVILGVMLYEKILPVTSSCGELNMVYVRGQGWMRLEAYEMYRLGVDQRFETVQAFDIDADPEARLLRIDQRHYVRRLAEIEVRKYASLQAAREMYADRSLRGQRNDAADVRVMGEAYKEAYGVSYELARHRITKQIKRFRTRQAQFKIKLSN